MNYRYIDSPVGRLLLAGDKQGLKFIGFPEGKGKIEPPADWKPQDACFQQAKAQLDEYFAGTRKQFDLQLAPNGTEFQLDVLEELKKIPYGETRSYGFIASRLGKPKASRAVGAANGRNPLPIVIPCHRVIGENGSLTGFGGGLGIKQFLLALESPERSLFRGAADSSITKL